MATFIVSYDLSNPGRNYERVLSAIKDNPGWARLGGSAYIVITERTAVELRNLIQAYLDNNDSLFVAAVGAPGAWIGLTEEVSVWLQNNLS